MNGIKMSDCKFYVNEEKRTVVCVISETKNMLRDFIEEHCNFNDVRIPRAIFNYWNDNDTMGIMPPSFMGKAVCAPEDKWNEETGRLLAYQRAKDKCYKSFFKRANRIIEIIDGRIEKMFIIFNDLGRKLEEKDQELQRKIDESMGYNIEE